MVQDRRKDEEVRIGKIRGTRLIQRKLRILIKMLSSRKGREVAEGF